MPITVESANIHEELVRQLLENSEIDRFPNGYPTSLVELARNLHRLNPEGFRMETEEILGVTTQYFQMHYANHESDPPLYGWFGFDPQTFQCILIDKRRPQTIRLFSRPAGDRGVGDVWSVLPTTKTV